MHRHRIVWFIPSLAWLLLCAPLSVAQPQSEISPKNFDIYGDPLPPNAVARLGTIRWRHPEKILAMEFGKDDKTLISVGDRSIRVWEVATGKLVRRIDFRGAENSGELLFPQTRCAAISPDCKTVAVAWEGLPEGPGNLITLWNVHDGKKRVTIRDKHVGLIGGMVAALAFSRDGKSLAGRYFWSTLVKLWDGRTGKLVGQLGKPAVIQQWIGSMQNKSHSLAFSGDGKRIVSLEERGQAIVWDVQKRKAIWQNTKKNAHYMAVCPHTDLFALVREDGTVLTKQFEELNRKPQILHTDSNSNCTSLVHHKHFLAFGYYWGDDRIRVWNVRTAKPLWSSEILNEPVNYLAISTDGNTLAASVGVSIRFWDMTTGKEISPRRGHVGRLWSVAISPDSKYIASQAGNGTLRVWNRSHCRRLWSARNLCFDARSTILFSPNGESIATLGQSSDGRLRVGRPIAEPQIRDVANGSILRPLVFPIFKPAGAASFFGILATASIPEILIATASISDENLLNYDACWDLVAFTPDGKTLVTRQSDHLLYHWDVSSGKINRQSPLHLKNAGSFECLSATGTRAAFFRPRRRLAEDSDAFSPPLISIHDYTAKKTISQFQPPDEPYFAWQFTPDGRSLVFSINHGFIGATNDKSNLLCLIEAHTGGIRRWFKAKDADNDIRQTAFSPDSRLFASASYGSIRLWDVTTGKQLIRFQAHDGAIADLTFSDDGKLLLSAGQDTTIMLWDVARLTKYHKYKYAAKLTAAELNSCWKTIAGDDATKAYDAMWTLVAAPQQAVWFLKKRLAPAAIDQQRIRRLLDRLSSSKFVEREKATSEIEDLGEWALPFLQDRLAKRSTLEVHRRLKTLVRKAKERPLQANQIRSLRAVEVLEHIGNDDAVAILRRLATGFGDARLTHDAAAAVQRLTKRRP